MTQPPADERGEPTDQEGHASDMGQWFDDDGAGHLPSTDEPEEDVEAPHDQLTPDATPPLDEGGHEQRPPRHPRRRRQRRSTSGPEFAVSPEEATTLDTAPPTTASASTDAPTDETALADADATILESAEATTATGVDTPELDAPPASAPLPGADGPELSSQPRPSHVELALEALRQERADDAVGHQKGQPRPSAGSGRDANQQGFLLDLRAIGGRLGRSSPEVAQAITDYADRVAEVAEGYLPPSAARPPDTLNPTLVGAILGGRSLAAPLELLRNILVFMPVLWTWWEIRGAASAYSEALAAEQVRPDASFLSLWQDGFGIGAHTLTDTATVAAVLVSLLIGVHLAASVARSRAEQAREREARSFAVLLSRNPFVYAAVNPETPQQQLDEFARAGIELSSRLAALSSTFTERSAPLAQSLASAERSMQAMSELVQRQSEQMAEVTRSLSAVTAISEHLGKTAASLDRTATALSAMQDRVGPATEQLAEATRQFGHTATLIGRATDNFAGSLEQSRGQADALEQAAQHLNDIANRFLDHSPEHRR